MRSEGIDREQELLRSLGRRNTTDFKNLGGYSRILRTYAIPHEGKNSSGRYFWGSSKTPAEWGERCRNYPEQYQQAELPIQESISKCSVNTSQSETKRRQEGRGESYNQFCKRLQRIC